VAEAFVSFFVFRVRWILSQLRSKGKVVRPWIGLQMNTLSPAQIRILNQEWKTQLTHGVYIAKVEESSPAWRAGIRDDCVLTHVNGSPILETDHLIDTMYDPDRDSINRPFEFTVVQRDTFQPRTFTVTPLPHPSY
jgi:S1-C subfamily serine protease